MKRKCSRLRQPEGRQNRNRVLRRRCRCLTAAGVAALGICMALTGCGGTDTGTNSSEERQQLTDAFAQIILTADAGSAAMDGALEGAADYVQSGEDADLLTAIDALEVAYEQLKELLDAYLYEEASDEFTQIMEAEGISALDYSTFTALIKEDLLSYEGMILQLEETIVDLYSGNADMDYFTALYELEEEELKLYIQYGWYMYVNYWFADWEGDALDYVQEQILDELDSFNSESLEWDTDRDSIEIRANAINDNLETVKNEMEELEESIE